MISILFPTCYRLEYLKSSYAALYETTKHLTPQFIFIVDEDQKSFDWLTANAPEQLILWRDTMQGSLTAWNYALPYAAHDLLFMAGDDSEAQPHWLDYVLETHQSMGNYGMVCINDASTFVGNLCTTPFYDKQFCRDYLGGVVVIPHYKRWATDNEMYERAVISGKYKWDLRAVIKHTRETVPNEHITRIHAEDFRTYDGKLLEARRKAGFPNDFPNII